MKSCITKSILLAAIYALFAVTHGDALSCELTIFGNANKPPKNYNDKQGKPHGILVDMMRYLGKEMDCKFNIQLYPWKRAYKYALQGKGGIIGFSKNAERLKIFDYSDVMFYDDMILVTTKEGQFTYNKIEDLSGKTLSVLAGGSYGDTFENAVKAKLFNVRPSTSPEERLLLLLGSQVDAVLIGPGKLGLHSAIARNKKLTQNREDFIALPKPFIRDPNFLGIAKALEKQSLIKRFNKALVEGVNSGKFDEIILDYLAKEQTLITP